MAKTLLRVPSQDNPDQDDSASYSFVTGMGLPDGRANVFQQDQAHSNVGFAVPIGPQTPSKGLDPSQSGLKTSSIGLPPIMPASGSRMTPFTPVFDPSASPDYVPPASGFVGVEDEADSGIDAQMNAHQRLAAQGVAMNVPPVFSPTGHLPVVSYPIADGSFQDDPSTSSASQQPRGPYFTYFSNSPIDDYQS